MKMKNKIMLATVAMMMVAAAMAQKNASAQADKHEYVDLGLPSGMLWATCNVGASRPEDYGDYFAWGETRGFKGGKTNFSWKTYKWCNGASDRLTKYCNKSDFGTVDNRTELLPEDDAAYVNWGSDWRMPTDVQQDELRKRCKWTWTSRDGVNGYEVKGPNGNVLFLPMPGVRIGTARFNAGSRGYYWSRSWSQERYDQYYAYSLDLEPVEVKWSFSGREEGISVRPVRAPGQ